MTMKKPAQAKKLEIISAWMPRRRWAGLMEAGAMVRNTGGGILGRRTI
jgi:hypothetical protein